MSKFRKSWYFFKRKDPEGTLKDLHATFYTATIFGRQFYPFMRDLTIKHAMQIKNHNEIQTNMYSNIKNTRNHFEIGTADMNFPICAIDNKTHCKMLLGDVIDPGLQVGKEQLLANGFINSNITCLKADITDSDESFTNGMSKLTGTDTDIVSLPFDSIALNFVLHCVPGTMQEKLPKVLNVLKSNGCLGVDTVFIGCTLLAPEKDSPFLAKKFFETRNHGGEFDNLNDRFEDVNDILNENFQYANVEKHKLIATWVCKGINN